MGFIKTKRFTIISLLLSLIVLVAHVIISIKMAHRYLELTDGKSRALFGLTALLDFSYYFYFVIPGITALAFSVTAFVRKENRFWACVSLFMALAALALFSVGLWQLWI